MEVDQKEHVRVNHPKTVVTMVNGQMNTAMISGPVTMFMPLYSDPGEIKIIPKWLDPGVVGGIPGHSDPGEMMVTL